MPELPFELVASGDELVAGVQIVLLVLVVNLHKKFGETVDVPDAHVLLEFAYEFCVGTAQDAEADARYSVTLGNTLHDDQVWESFQKVVTQKCIGAEIYAEVNETFVYDEPNFLFLGPIGQS